MNLDQLLTAFDMKLEGAEIRTEKVGDGLFVLFGVGGNIAVSVGDQGVLVVDDMFPELAPQVREAIRKVGGGDVDFAINTHWHFDHAQGNLAFGPEGTWIVAQENSSKFMGESHDLNLVVATYRQEAYPENARPVISFDDSMRFHFNGERIDLLHAGPAHTTGDTAVFFRGHDAVHMGDVFNNTGYPFIDADNGGEIDGMIAFCKAILAEMGPNTVLIPGHGELADRAALQRYVGMLETVRDRVADLIAQGKTLDEVERGQADRRSRPHLRSRIGVARLRESGLHEPPEEG